MIASIQCITSRFRVDSPASSLINLIASGSQQHPFKLDSCIFLVVSGVQFLNFFREISVYFVVVLQYHIALTKCFLLRNAGKMPLLPETVLYVIPF